MTWCCACLVPWLLVSCTAVQGEPAAPAAPPPSEPVAAPSPRASVPPEASHGDDEPHEATGAGNIGLNPHVSIGCRAPRLGSAHVSAALDELQLAGPRSEELVRRVLLRHLARFAGCYEPARRTQPAPEGSFMFSLRSAPTGQVTEATVDRLSPGLARGRGCLQRLLQRVIIPAEDPALGPARVVARVRLWPRAPGEPEVLVADCMRSLH